MAKRSGRPRTARWRARLEDQARDATTSRVRHVAATTTDPITREVYTQEAAIREAITPALCRHGAPEGHCPACAACDACTGDCGTCPY